MKGTEFKASSFLSPVSHLSKFAPYSVAVQTDCSRQSLGKPVVMARCLVFYLKPKVVEGAISSVGLVSLSEAMKLM